MKNIELCFDPELADFFRIESRIRYPLHRRASIKDIIEALGVPHTEVGEILVDDRPESFNLIPGTGQKLMSGLYRRRLIFPSLVCCADVLSRLCAF